MFRQKLIPSLVSYIAVPRRFRGTQSHRKESARRLQSEHLEDRRLLATASNPMLLQPAGDQVFFSAEDPVHGRELWVTDGTARGTMLVKDIQEGPTDSHPRNFESVGNLLYFTATDAVFGEELWVTDGTEDGTQLVADIRPGDTSSFPFRLTAVGDQLFFTVLDEQGRELGKMPLDPATGSPAGQPELVKDIYLGFSSSDPIRLTPVGDQLFFTALSRIDGVKTGRELWVSDGTATGTQLVKDFLPGAVGSYPEQLTEFNGQLFFAVTSITDLGDIGEELWTSDGTAAGTFLVKDIRPGAESSHIQGLTVFDNRLLFTANDGVHGHEIWTSDGTPNGTQPLTDLNPGSPLFIPGNFEVVGDQFYFTAIGDEGQLMLGISDGTATGTELFHELISSAALQSGAGFYVVIVMAGVGDELFFTALREDETGVELWKTDGSAAGTRLVRDIAVGPTSSSPSSMIPLGDSLIFVARHPVRGSEVWVSDGTARGTQPVQRQRPRLTRLELDVPGTGTATANSSTTSTHHMTNRGYAAQELRASAPLISELEEETDDETRLGHPVIPHPGLK